jgi:hypothetical protein
VINEKSGDEAKYVNLALDRFAEGIGLGSIHEQQFYAIRANGQELRFPFTERPFTALVHMPQSVDDALLASYAKELVKHGCVQAVCRGEDSDRMVDIFDALAERGDHDSGNAPFTSMCLGDEPLREAIQYFILPCGLAQTGLLMVIGESGDFDGAIADFLGSAGSITEGIGEPVYTEENLVCFSAM